MVKGVVARKKIQLFYTDLFYSKTVPDSSVVDSICKHCNFEFSYHRSASNLKYHFNALHTIDARKPPTQTSSCRSFRKTMLDAACGSSIARQQDKLTFAIAKWLSTNCRLIRLIPITICTCWQMACLHIRPVLSMSLCQIFC